MARKDFLDIVSLDREEIIQLLDQAEPFKDLFTRSVKKVPALKGKTVLMLFYEPSTRTLSSFEVAAKRLSADVTTFDVPSSSVTKGESVRDTIDTLQAMRADYIVVRHGLSGQPAAIARQTGASVINAGDGAHEHPSQALLDMLTVREQKGRIEGLTITIIGDIAHSRVARSNIYGFKKLGAEVRVAGPPTMLPADVEKSLGVKAYTNLAEAIEGADVVMALRIQMERLEGACFPSVREYAATFGLDRAKLRYAKEDAIVMHPGPVNRGVELSHELADDRPSVILDQVRNGVALRMALLYLVAGRGGH